MSWRFWESPAPAPAPDVLRCSFCGKSQHEVSKLIAGPAHHICEGCVALAKGVVDEAAPTLPTPDELADLPARLTARVPGRDATAAALSNLLAHHVAQDAGPPAAVLLGPRGSGKTALLNALVAEAGVPAVRVDAGRLSASGYVGDDLENWLGELRRTGPQLAHRGLLAIDNLHHLAAREKPEGTAVDVRGTRAQRQLLRLLDGRRVRAVLGRRHPSQPPHWMDTGGLMVVFAATVETAPAARTEAVAALQALGIEPAVLKRIPVVLPTPRRDAAALAEVARRIAATLGVADPDADALGAAAAGSPDGAWVVQQALRAAALP